MQSNWLDATLNISPEESRVLEWMEAVMLGEEELPDLTNDGICDILREWENERD